MSTFKGVISEFPQIRIDFFRAVPGREAPLAGFLSHVHSDHLQGLESVKGMFVYCSPATREILLRLEKYPHRMNFAKGILETRVQTYKHLKNLLKTIPLGSPTTVELSPGNEIQVTLFDSNHCTGAVMFLIQGSGKAVLYTGDIRSEPWWVNSLVQNPVLIPYTLGPKRLDNIYLDTTFASNAKPQRDFPLKAQGLRELLEKVDRYPQNTIFYIEAWTFGYENVWIALSSFLNSPIHLDRYRWSIYKSLGSTTRGAPECVEAPPLVGFMLGNHSKEGCLTNNPDVRLHSCERGTGCPVTDKNDNVVRIVPIVTRLKNGVEVHEMGIGGGKGDLNQTFELELDDASIVVALFKLCAARITDQEVLLKIYSLLQSAVLPGQAEARFDLEAYLDQVKLEDLVDILAHKAKEGAQDPKTLDANIVNNSDEETVRPKQITFPYSRHSSYSELCELVAAFQPKDIYPCTVDEPTWSPEASMRALFGHHCSSNVFAHDAEMMALYEAKMAELNGGESQDKETQTDTQTTNQSVSQQNVDTPPIHRGIRDDLEDIARVESGSQTQAQDETKEVFFTPQDVLPGASRQVIGSLPSSSSKISHFPATQVPAQTPDLASPAHSHTRPLSRSFPEAITPPKRPRVTGDPSIRTWAYRAAAGLDEDVNGWDTFGGLTCVKVQDDEIELGHDADNDETDDDETEDEI